MTTEQASALAGEAIEKFQEGFACSQAVFSSLVTQESLPEDVALRIAAPFGGGLAHTGQVCGAVSGALMALGLYRGSSEPDPAAKERTYALAQQFLARFKATHGSILCPDLLGCDLSTPEGLKRARQEKLTSKICPVYVRDAVVSVAAVLDPP